jgi:type II secretory pathway pseudopilin PulG
MMLLSRIWYMVLAVVGVLAVAVVTLAVGQYNRRNQVAMTENLAADAQVVRWALQIDARRRLDAMLVGSVDKGVQDALVAASDKDKIPSKAKDDCKKALQGVLEKLPAEYKPDAIFAVDRDGRLVAQVGYDAAARFEDFELGGYPAVNDALHGYLRDDTWVWGNQVYRVVARPVEYDVTQPPAGAVVALRAVDRKFAQDLAKLTRTNLVFYVKGNAVASAANDAADDSILDRVTPELAKLGEDKTYAEKGRSEVHAIDDTTGALFTRMEGDAWEIGAGVGVARTRANMPGPMGFISGADDKDKAQLFKTGPLVTMVTIFLLGILGIVLTIMEHSRPLKGFAVQVARLKKGEVDLLELPKIGGGYRDIAADLNAGIERVAEKGGGAPRKAADLESILGPVPAQPAMSAFAFPLAGGGDAALEPPKPPPPGPPKPPLPKAPTSQPNLPGPVLSPNAPTGPSGTVPELQRPVTSPTVVQPAQKPAPGLQQPATTPMPIATKAAAAAPAAAAPASAAAPTPAASAAAAASGGFGPGEEEDEATMVAAVPKEVLAQATGASPAGDEAAEWMAVYEEFLKVKKQCGEPTEGLTFEKFQLTLKKNRDALVQRHNCKRVKFTVYVKEGRASLKATPVKE